MTERSLKVLMLNRPDSQAVPGGDTVQMMRTKTGLECLGVQVTIGENPDPSSVSQFDLVHIFNWQQLGEIRAKWGIEDAKVPVVVSTIFWFHTGHWFEEAARSKKLWRAAARAVGQRQARRIYETWQRLKFRKSAAGLALSENLQAADLLLPNSQIEIDHLEGILGLRGRFGAKSVVVPNGVDQGLLSQPAGNSAFAEQFGSQPFVLQVARIQSAKNQVGLLQALAQNPVPVVFAGQPSPYETEYVAALQDLAKRRGNTFFTGQLQAEELRCLYASAAVHALPSWRETPGLASLEAAAAGCRIVSTSIGSAREYFGAQAWYCDPASTESIRKAVLQALASPEPAGLRERVLTRFTWDAAAKATLSGYNKVLSSNQKTTNIGEKNNE